MPNWVRNTINMKGISKIDSLFSVAEDGHRYFDFNKIIPQPTTKEECIEKYGEKYIDNGDKHLQHSDGDEWFNWYDWHCNFWGTKWNACDSSIDSDDSISFDTAWAAPGPIFEKLSLMFPDEEIECISDYYEYCEGIIHATFKNGEIISSYEEDYEEYDYEEDEEE